MLAPDALNSHIDRLIDSFREELKSNTDGFIKNLDVLSLLCMDHQRTNDVRHQFKTMSVEDARVTTRHISRFMPLAGIIGVSDRTIKKYIASLQSENKIKRIGPDKGGHWEVLQ
jgi:predicted HTH transcriptional regulator